MKADYRTVGKSVRKTDALALAAGGDPYTDDHRLENPLHAVLVYSTEAHAALEKLDVFQAAAVPGVVDILTHENTPRIWHTTAGQGYPEPSPYDALLFDRVVRFVGDRVAHRRTTSDRHLGAGHKPHRPQAAPDSGITGNALHNTALAHGQSAERLHFRLRCTNSTNRLTVSGLKLCSIRQASLSAVASLTPRTCTKNFLTSRCRP